MCPIHSTRRLEWPLAAGAALLLAAGFCAAPAWAQTVCKDDGVEYILGGAAGAGPGCKAAAAPQARRALRTAQPVPTQSPAPRRRERADVGQDERRLILEAELKKAQQVLHSFSQTLGGRGGLGGPEGSAVPAEQNRALADVRALTAELARMPPVAGR